MVNNLLLLVGLSIYLFLVGCDSSIEQTSKSPESNIKVNFNYKKLGFHPGSSSKFGSYFVYVDLAGFSKSESYQNLVLISKELCVGKSMCIVHYWDDEMKAGRSIPLSDSESDAMIASYVIQGNSGEGKYQCHPFGEYGMRCNE